MSTRSLIQLIGMLVLAVALLPACGDVSGGDFTVERGNWPWPWLHDADVFVDDTFTEEVPVRDHLRIRLEAVNGQVWVTGRPGADSVRIAAELRVGSHSFADALEGLGQLEVRVTDRPDEILVQTVQPHDAKGRQYLVTYTITLPPDLEVDLTQANGHVTVEGVGAAVFVDVVNGNIDTRVAAGGAAEIRLSAVNGALDLRIPTGTSAALSAFTGNGTISWNNLDFVDLVHKDRSLEGTLGDGAGVIDLETTNGNIEVTGIAD